MEKSILQWLVANEGNKGTPEWDGSERRKPRAVIGIPYSSDAAENTDPETEEKTMKRIGMYMFTTAAVAAAAMILASCGGGGGGGTTSSAGGTTGTAVATTGTMTKGSVKANGVHFLASATAKIRQEDNGVVFEVQPAQMDGNVTKEDKLLRDGMNVKVKGRISDNPATAEVEGEFDKVKPEPEVRGLLKNRNAGGRNDDFTVNGRHVIVDDNTVFEDRTVTGANTTFAPIGTRFAGLAIDDRVEVHGGLDDLGNIRATRVERRNDNPNDEAKGTVSGLPGATFTLTYGTTAITVDPASATVTPAGASVNNGNTVEVYGTFDVGTNTLAATRIHIEDLEDAEFEPVEGQEQHVEGYVSGFASISAHFQVGDTTVDASAAKFVGGSLVDMANGVKVEAEGHHSVGILVASKIEFRRPRVVLEGNAAGLPGTVLGKTVVTTSATRNTYTSGRVRIRGYQDPSGNIVAERIENAGGGTKDTVQAVVTAKAEPSLTLFGFAANTTGTTVFRDKDPNHTAITQAVFFAAVTPKSATNAGTVVKVKGTVTGSTIAVEEAELED